MISCRMKLLINSKFLQCNLVVRHRAAYRVTGEHYGDGLRYVMTCALYMMTSSNGNISALLAICAGKSPVAGEFPAQRPVTRNFDVFFDLRLTKRLSKQSQGWWFETLSRLLWRHCNVYAAPELCHHCACWWIPMSSKRPLMLYVFS